MTDDQSQEKEVQEKVEQEITDKDNEEASAKSHADILFEQIYDAENTFNHSPLSLMASSLTAGLEIGFSYLLLVVGYHSLMPYLPEALVFKSFALFYPLGFVMVVIGQSLLFTEQTSLLSLSVLSDRQSPMALFRLWFIVIVGNLVGGWLFVLGTIWLGPQMALFTHEDVAVIATHVIDHPFYIILASAVLAGWMMGLLSWLVTSADSTMSRIVIVFLITGSIALLQLHHSIVGNVEVFAGLITSSDIGLADYLSFQFNALLGNAIGGAVFVGVLKYRIFVLDTN